MAIPKQALIIKAHVADPSITSILTPWPLVYELLGNNRSYWKGKLTATQQVILFTWFLKSSFGEHSYVTRCLYILCPVRKPYLHTSSSVSLLPDFPILFLLNPWPSSQIPGSSLCIDVEPFVWPFIIPGKVDTYMLCSKSCAHFPSPCPKGGLQRCTFPLIAGLHPS